MNARNDEKGSALIIIFIGIILFAALSFTVANMMRGSSADNLTREKTQIAASEILEYAQRVRGGTQNLRISDGCSDTDVSFEAQGLTGYAHSPAVSDSCKLFVGGGLSYVPPQDVWLDDAHTGDPTYGQYVLARQFSVSGLGTNEPDLALTLNYMRKDVCMEINTRLDIPNDASGPPKDTGAFHSVEPFIGVYDATADTVDAAALVGKPAGCAQSADGSNNVFYQVLIAR